MTDKALRQHVSKLTSGEAFKQSEGKQNDSNENESNVKTNKENESIEVKKLLNQPQVKVQKKASGKKVKHEELDGIESEVSEKAEAVSADGQFGLGDEVLMKLNEEVKSRERVLFGTKEQIQKAKIENHEMSLIKKRLKSKGFEV